MIDNLFILSSTGEVLIEKHWLGRMKRTVCEVFWEEVQKVSSRAEVLPVIAHPKYYMIHSQRSELFFLSVVRKDVPPLFVLEAQQKIIDTFIDYFKKISEASIRENFSIVIQLLDEMVDGGFPFTTEVNQLKEMIYPPTLFKQMIQALSDNFSVQEKLSGAASSTMPWRKSDVKYVTNEVYFDVVESVDATIGSNGMPITQQVFGEVRANVRLSGTPDLTLTFNHPSMLDDVSLHRCVRINRFEREKVISFVPPDGEFKLMSYRVDAMNCRLPLYVKPTISFGKSSGNLHITVGTKVDDDKPVTNVVILIPLPADCSASGLSANFGVLKLPDNKTNICRWELPRIPKDKIPTLEGSLSFSSDASADEQPVVRVEFTCKQYSASGLKVDGLQIRGVSYKPFKGVRVITQGGKFQIRC